jgi:hypothetical protein
LVDGLRIRSLYFHYDAVWFGVETRQGDRDTAQIHFLRRTER